MAIETTATPAATATPKDALAEAAKEAPKDAAKEAPKEDTTDWKAEARKWETRSKENKAAAEAFAELQEKQKTDEQKLAEKLAALETENSKLKSAQMAAVIAAKHELPATALGFLKGSTEDELEDSAKSLKALLGSVSPAKSGPAPVHTQGATSAGGGTGDPVQDLADAFRQAGMSG